MKPRHIVLGVILLVAAAFAIFGDKSPTAAVVEPAPRNAAVTPPARARADTPAAPTQDNVVMIMRLQPRTTTFINEAETFGARNWTPPPAPPAPPPPAPPPSAPPLPFTYIGKAVANGEWEVFLARGSETLIVRNKMTLDGAWRVDSIAPPSITFTYLPLNQVQQLNIGVLD